MEAISLMHVISTAYGFFPTKYCANPNPFRKFGSDSPHLSFIISSKKWDFQDFQGYAKPKELFRASEVKIFRPSSLEQIMEFFKLQKCEFLYKVKLQTSSIYGSTLTDANSSILLCLIDEDNNSILQRIPPCLQTDHTFKLKNHDCADVLNFQRGCVDEFIFEGQPLGRIAAVWIGPESGQWRLGNLSLTVFWPHLSPPPEGDTKPMLFVGVQYDFDIEDTLLGEGSDFSMVEIRPSSVTDFSEKGYGWLDVKPLHSSSVATNTMSSEESMKAYAELKCSMLLYDALLVLSGSLTAWFSAGENSALAFLTGGVGGFLYLLLLQRSVDGLPMPESVSTNGTENLNQILGKFRGALSSLVLAFVFAAIVAKYTSGEAETRVLTPNDLILGMFGFVMCKVSVLLAAFKPMPRGTQG